MYNQYVTWKKKPLATGQSRECEMSQNSRCISRYLETVTIAASLPRKGNGLNVSLSVALDK